ncbi:MAG: nodulation protein NfeD [Betaproteobacteria bacterium]|nr:nodulation protein NfeD [Betaproteobacteria bacterium]MBI2508501.1 nodulation protein NfeD [Betaproteobacteria bacterium]
MCAFRRLLALAAMLPALSAPVAATETPVVLLTLEGAVSPATADYVVRGIRKAADQGAGLVVLQIDTPGGLDTSMRRLIKEILSSPVPVAAFVAPGGARAASAGTFILYASHIAAMAPATNLGAASPVQIGVGGPGGEPSKAPEKAPAGKAAGKDGKAGAKEQETTTKDTLTRKITHDAAAYIRSLAQLRGRNAEWGEQAVREAVSLSAADALKRKVIDVVAQDVPDLLKKIDGRKVTVQGVERALETAGAPTVSIEPDWRSELLAVIANPSIALILMMIGIYGLLFEFSNPGFVLPGVVGGICLLLAFYAFQLLPVNYAGVALILLGIAFLVAEAFLPSFGALGIGGAIALVFGSVILVDPEAAGGYAMPLPFVVTLALASAALVFLTVLLALKARRRPVVSGREDIVGARGEVVEGFEREGWVRVHGENWRVTSAAPLGRGQKVRVVGINGLTLQVEPETTQGETS